MPTNSISDNSLSTNRELTATPSNQTVQDSVGLLDWDDYYRVNFTNRSSVSLSLTGLSDNANLQLLNSTGSVIARSAKGGKLDETIDMTLNPGTYYIHVNRDNVLVRNANYSLNYRAFDVGITSGTKVDFDGDGKSDILWRNESSKELTAWLMNGLSIKAGAAIGHNPMGSEWQVARIADFDGDGKSDILWRNESSKELTAWLMNGLSIKAGAAIGHNPMGSEWQVAGIADFDGDGKSDILWRNESTKGLTAWLMDGLSIKAGATIGHNPVSSEWQIAGIADFDGDGKSDILWRNESTKGLTAWLMNGLSIKAGATIGHNPVGSEWQVAGIADFDGDGKSDILWRNESSKGLTAWLMNGLSIKAGATIGHNPVGSEWQVAGITDFDGDGKSDILWRNKSSKGLTAWLMNGLSIKAGATIGHNPVGSEWQVARIADFDGDGKSDILWRNESSKELTAWLMNGLSIKAGAAIGHNPVGSEWQIIGSGGKRPGYRSELTSLTTSNWDRYSGESAQFGKYGADTAGDKVREAMPNNVLAVYEDLSKAVFGSVKQVTTGYAYDESYLTLGYDYHAGIDIGADNGNSIKAATNGIVAKAYLGKRSDGTSYGYVVGIDETDASGQKTGRRWWYVHNTSNSVKVGSSVIAGQTEIGKVGQGHLHLAVTSSSDNTDPYNGKNAADVLNRTMSPLEAFWKSRNNIIGY